MSEFRYGLGLDQGVGSIGWAVLRLDADGQAVGIERMGTHLFEAGTEGDIARGKDESRAGPRRMARQNRKKYRRTWVRKRRLLKLLQGLGLMPVGDVTTPEVRDALLKGLDAELRTVWEGADADHRMRQLLPYRLRAAGLERRLEPFELGRAIYHLAQRRGYLSNRKQLAEEQAAEQKGKGASEAGGEGEKGKKEDVGAVAAGIDELKRQMEAAKCRTLGEYFAKLDPTGGSGDRIRRRWTAREMFKEEFGRLWSVQAGHHAQLTEEARKQVYRAIFFQRPLKGAAHLIGRCELVPGERRAPLGCRVAQRFRMLAAVNNLEILLPDYTRRILTRDERDRLVQHLSEEGDVTFAALKTKKWFGLPKGSRFNLEEGGEKRLVGHRTDAKLRAIFGEAWGQMSEERKDRVVADLLLFEKPGALAKRGQRVYGLDAEAAQKLGVCVLEPGYAAHSERAMRTLLSRMEEGTRYMTAKVEEFPHTAGDTAVVDELPPVESALGAVRNPAVTRALTELRKLVNAVVRRYGKPEWVRLELARDLKRSRKQRERLSEEMRARESEREKVRAKIVAKGIVHPSRSDIERVLLAEECSYQCPYTGRSFGLEDVIGRHPQVDVEHIWPMSRSLDDSYLNKTLCYHEENRNVKGNWTPLEAYGGNPAKWQEILERVRKFKGDAAREKYRRFVEPMEEGFAERHLAETRLISAKSADYLGMLYGGAVAEHRRRVFVSTGGLTAHLRREWHLDGILGFKDTKNRADHRHHAIDAVVIGLTDTRTVQMLQRAAEEASAKGRRMFAPMEMPWPTFLEDVRAGVEAINVSYRQSRRARGALHADSNYSRAIRNGTEVERRIRKPLAKLSEAEVERIIDRRCREAVAKRLTELKLPPAKAFADEANRPELVDKAGRRTRIRAVRIAVRAVPAAIGHGASVRYVGPTQGSNHHTVLTRGADGRWHDQPVSLLDLGRDRQLAKAPKRPAGGGEYTLAAGEYVLYTQDGEQRLCRVLSLTDGEVELVEHCDGRLAADRRKEGARIRVTGGGIGEGRMQKVTVSYLGEIRRAGG
ncbi:MAG: type II CRISPR RNA-guided endonuclease Cas9 [Planctomycetaceae bacterium]|jgi:CRISPR-associated endonuclease Csn1|nr:type II CRISPR RNA-guided endonuclease Cas9 [Phycisphaerales bacterium]MCE2654693.1 type II CRISPR RNA-guided endonuclease Cas9 [Planctomycetaceae bacterium]